MNWLLDLMNRIGIDRIPLPPDLFGGVASALLVFLFFLVLCRVFTRYVLAVILKLTARTATSLDDSVARSLEKPLRDFFIILGAYLALNLLPLSMGQNLLVSRVFRSAIIILIAWGLYTFIATDSLLFEQFQIRFNNMLAPFFSKALQALVVIMAVLIVATEWGYDINGLIAGLGLGGLAAALAAKDALANIFGGIMIIMEKSFAIGDWILTPSVEGTVEDINFRSTRVRTFAQALVTVPNATLANEPITNWSRMGKRQVTFHLGVTYSTSRQQLARCVEAIREMLENHPGIHKETIMVNFERFNDSSLDIFLYFFTITTSWKEYLEVREDVNFKIMAILEREGVEVAFPSQSIYIEQPEPDRDKKPYHRL